MNGCVRCVVCLWCLGLVLEPSIVSAQDGVGLRRGHFTFGVGVTQSGGYDVGDASAQLRGNGPGASPTPVTLFNANSRFTPAAAPTLRIGIALSRMFALEGSASYGHPRIAVSISGDAEAPAQELPGEQVQQYQFEAGLTWQLPIRIGRRVAPFAAIGGGYLRQLHEGRTLVETGQVYHAGVGARYWLRGGGPGATALGVRGDARLNFRRHGIDFDGQMRAYPSVSLSAFIGL